MLKLITVGHHPPCSLDSCHLPVPFPKTGTRRSRFEQKRVGRWNEAQPQCLDGRDTFFTLANVSGQECDPFFQTERSEARPVEVNLEQTHTSESVKHSALTCIAKLSRRPSPQPVQRTEPAAQEMQFNSIIKNHSTAYARGAAPQEFYESFISGFCCWEK